MKGGGGSKSGSRNSARGDWIAAEAKLGAAVDDDCCAAAQGILADVQRAMRQSRPQP